MNRQIKSIFSLTVLLFAIPLFVGAKVPTISGPQIEDVTQKVFPCVVKVEVRNLMRKVATGVVIDRNGHIVTTALITPRDEEIFNGFGDSSGRDSSQREKTYPYCDG